MGNLIARANASSIMYSQAGTYTCTAERPNEDPVEKTLIVTVQCGKWTSIRNFYSYGLTIWWKEFISFKYWPMNISERTSQCPNSPTNLFCLSNSECNRCKRTSGAHEQCSVYSSTPVCDVDSTVSGIQDTGDRKLAECVQCRKDGMLRLTLLWMFDFLYQYV